MKYLEKVLKLTGNKRRLMILSLLKKKSEATVGEIANSIKLSLTATSRHLALLRALDIVDKEQRGLEVYYFLSKNKSRIVRNILSEL